MDFDRRYFVPLKSLIDDVRLGNGLAAQDQYLQGKDRYQPDRKGFLEYVGDVYGYIGTAALFLRSPNMGRTSLDQLQKSFEKIGLKFPDPLFGPATVARWFALDRNAIPDISMQEFGKMLLEKRPVFSAPALNLGTLGVAYAETARAPVPTIAPPSMLNLSNIPAQLARAAGAEEAGLAALREALNGELGVQTARAIETIIAITKPHTQTKAAERAGIDQRQAKPVIFTGVGKSFDIAANNASSWSSLHVLSLALDANTASHGSLGVIQPGCGLIAVSKSGEAVELLNPIARCQKMGVPIIAITCAPNSALARAATIPLILPNVPEAVAYDAPTTSTTLQKALCDCMLASIVEICGIQPEDYGSNHPNGALGRALKTVGEALPKNAKLPFIRSGSSISAALDAIGEGKLGCVIVVNEHRQLLGIFTDGDSRRAWKNKVDLEEPIDRHMSTHPKTVLTTENLNRATERMVDEQVGQMIVVSPEDPTRVCGLIDLKHRL